jgi:hypothetical protein
MQISNLGTVYEQCKFYVGMMDGKPHVKSAVWVEIPLISAAARYFGGKCRFQLEG